MSDDTDHPCLTWADRAGLITAFAIAAAALYTAVITLLAAKTMVSPRLDEALAAWTVIAEIGIALPLWLLLRAIAYLFRGPLAQRHALAHSAHARFVGAVSGPVWRLRRPLGSREIAWF